MGIVTLVPDDFRAMHPASHPAAIATVANGAAMVGPHPPGTSGSKAKAKAPDAASKLATYRKLWRRRDTKASTAAAKMTTKRPRGSAPNSPSDCVLPQSSRSEPSSPSAAPAPATASGVVSRRMTEEEKIEKHRMIVRRAYYQKKELKARLRDEIADLEVQYQNMVIETRDAERHRQQYPCPPHCATCATFSDLRSRFREASVTKEALRIERDALEQHLLDQMSFSDKLEGFLQREIAEHALGGMAKPVLPRDAFLSAIPDSMMIHTSEFTVALKPLSEDDCFEFVRVAHTECRSQTTCSGFVEVGIPVMGWNRKRSYGTRPSFSFLKSFPGQSAEVLWNQTWRLYTESSSFARLYSGAVDIKFHVLQRVNDNNVLFCRTLKTQQLKVRNASFFLLSRFQLDGKFYVMFRSIDHARIHSDHPKDAVFDMFTWFRFEKHPDGGDPGCDIEFGGSVPTSMVADSDFWLMEFLSYLLRLENRAIAPQFRILL